MQETGLQALTVGSGWLMPCFSGGNAIQNIFEDLDEPIHFCAIGANCPWTHCYAAHVLLSSGVIPTLDTPGYDSFRDRICKDGSVWLTNSVRMFFNSKLCESNLSYSKDKKAFVNALMAIEYGNEVTQSSEVSDAILRSLRKKGIRSLVIWNNNHRLAPWLIEQLKATEIKIKYAVDIQYVQNASIGLRGQLKQRFKYRIKRLLNQEHPINLNRFDQLPRADAVIILDHAHFSSIKKQLPNRFTKILSLTELVD